LVHDDANPALFRGHSDHPRISVMMIPARC
jgi:hypothetical protein